MSIQILKCWDVLAHPLYLLWHNSLELGVIPTTLKKKAQITPPYKGSEVQLPKNYWPIALTSHIIKIFEKIIRNKVNMENNLLNKNQNGFRKGRLCSHDASRKPETYPTGSAYITLGCTPTGGGGKGTSSFIFGRSWKSKYQTQQITPYSPNPHSMTAQGEPAPGHHYLPMPQQKLKT